MNKISGAFIFLSFAGLVTSPAFSNIDKHITFFNKFNKMEKNLLKGAVDEWIEFLKSEACAKNKGFRAGGGILCFNPIIRATATSYCAPILKMKKEVWEKTACAKAGKSKFRKFFRNISGDVDKVLDLTKFDTQADKDKIYSDPSSFKPDGEKKFKILLLNKPKEAIIKLMNDLNQALDSGQSPKTKTSISDSPLCENKDQNEDAIKEFCEIVKNNKVIEKDSVLPSLEKTDGNKKKENKTNKGDNISNKDIQSSLHYKNIYFFQTDKAMENYFNFLCNQNIIINKGSMTGNKEDLYKSLNQLGETSLSNIDFLIKKADEKAIKEAILAEKKKQKEAAAEKKEKEKDEAAEKKEIDLEQKDQNIDAPNENQAINDSIPIIMAQLCNPDMNYTNPKNLYNISKQK